MRKLEEIFNRLSEFGLLTDDEEKTINESLLAIESKIVPKTHFMLFIDEYNKVRGTKYLPNTESRKLYYKHEQQFSNTDRINALQNALTDPWVAERASMVTPQYILKEENLSKYLNYAAPKSSIPTKQNIAATDYTNVTI